MAYNIDAEKARYGPNVFEKTNEGGAVIDQKTVIFKQQYDESEYIVRKEVNHYLFPVVKQASKHKTTNDNQQMVLYRYYCSDPKTLGIYLKMKRALLNKKPIGGCTWPVSIGDMFSCETEYQNIVLASEHHFDEINLDVNGMKEAQKGNDFFMNPERYEKLRKRANDKDEEKRRDKVMRSKARRMLGGVEEKEEEKEKEKDEKDLQ